jgi:hypothetical protein
MSVIRPNDFRPNEAEPTEIVGAEKNLDKAPLTLNKNVKQSCFDD